MKQYRQVSYQTLTGVKKLIDISDLTYGEWIIYNNKLPMYYVDIFDKVSGSNMLIEKLLTSKSETVESLINKINLKQGTNLSLAKRPLIEIVKSSEFLELDLISLPETWIKSIIA